MGATEEPLVGVGGVRVPPDVGWEVGGAGRAPGIWERVNPNLGSLLVGAVGVEGLLAFAGGRPVGVEGGALFLPFLGGVLDIEDEF
jgi:hypothetical protein